MVEEVTLFVRSAVFGAVVGAVYWFLTYEVAGTLLLVGTGMGTLVVAAVLWLGLDRRWRRPATQEVDARPDRPFEDEEGPIPAPTIVPFAVALGVALVMLGLVFNPALTITGTIVALIAAREWLRAAVAEGSR